MSLPRRAKAKPSRSNDNETLRGVYLGEQRAQGDRFSLEILCDDRNIVRHWLPSLSGRGRVRVGVAGAFTARGVTAMSRMCRPRVRAPVCHSVLATGHAQRDHPTDRPQGNLEAVACHADQGDGDGGLVAEGTGRVGAAGQRGVVLYDALYKSGAIVAELEKLTKDHPSLVIRHPSFSGGFVRDTSGTSSS